MNQPLTKKDLKDALKPLATKEEMSSSEERLAESIRGINLSLTQHLSRIEGKVDYIAQNAALRSELRSLVAQLKAQGIELDESKIFAV